jgi:CBS-domain-containing membrane protein
MWIRKTINEFRLFWKNYLFQSVLAVFALALAMLILNIGKRPVLIASVGATAFIAFAMPGELAAKPKSIIGGHLIGFLSGAIFSVVPHSSTIGSTIVYSFAVGLSLFLMVVLDFEHPPASGTALAIVSEDFSLNTFVGLFTSILIILIVAHIFRGKLRNLV